MSEQKIPIPSMIYNASVGGHVTNSQQIIDENENKEQSQINAEVKQSLGQGGSVDARINQAKNDIIGGASSNGNTLKKIEDRVSPLESAVGSGGSIDARIAAAKSEIKGNATSACNTLGKAETKINANTSAISAEASRAQAAEQLLQEQYNALTQSDIIVGALPSSGTKNKIYRVPGTNTYSDYMWNGSSFVKMATYNNAIDTKPTHESSNLITSGGVFEVTNNAAQSFLDDSYSVLNIGDKEGNVILKVDKEGNIGTKNFNSNFVKIDDSNSDLNIGDPDGNVLLQLKNGHIRTKNFDSRNSGGSVTNSVRGVIFDTDWWTDVDDAMAIRTLLWAERCGMIDLIGVCVSAIRNTSIPSIAKFLNEEGRGGLTIACDKQATDYDGTPSYHQTIIDSWNYSDGYNSTSDAEDCVTFYRKALSEQSEPIDIICVGYGNTLSRLLNSTADTYSDLSGIELVREKVRKLWWMAGAYPSGSENNMTKTSRSRTAAYNVCNDWPTEIVFLGFEVGENVISGKNLNTYTNDNDLLYKAMYQLVGSNGRSSWDPMTVLLAAFDNKDVAGYTYVKGTNSVNSSTGANVFTPSNSGKHSYVVKKHPDWWYVHQIDSIIRLNSWPSRVLGNKQL